MNMTPTWRRILSISSVVAACLNLKNALANGMWQSIDLLPYIKPLVFPVSIGLLVVCVLWTIVEMWRWWRPNSKKHRLMELADPLKQLLDTYLLGITQVSPRPNEVPKLEAELIQMSEQLMSRANIESPDISDYQRWYEFTVRLVPLAIEGRVNNAQRLLSTLPSLRST